MQRCLWISPSAVTPQAPPTSSQRFAASVAGHCEMVVVGLRVWSLGPAEPYDLATEIGAAQRLTDDLGWDRYHLFGFSAGATVALALARAQPESVATLALVEPATIGDDDWSTAERRWRDDLTAVRRLPPTQQQTAFRALVMAPGEAMPPGLAPPPSWDPASDRLEDVLAAVGFDSSDLADLVQPTLIMSGGRSNPRFRSVAERLVEVLPDARSVIFPDSSHLNPPHRNAPDQLADELARLWQRR